jgi:hypothetical protein
MTPEQIEEIKSRKCGTCYSCCVNLGIDELKKYPAQNCKHLDGGIGPETRCSIYKDRPTACHTYRCAWLQGLGTPDMRPDKSGLLVTTYNPHFENSGTMSATICITNPKIGDPKDLQILNQEPLHQVLTSLLEIHCKDIRIVAYHTLDIIHILDGQIFRGVRQKNSKGKYEELVIATFNPPAGVYRIEERTT